MRLTGQALSAKEGLFTARVEKFQDDRFRLMFILTNKDGKDIRWLPVEFSKSTKTIDLDQLWPKIEDELKISRGLTSAPQ